MSPLSQGPLVATVRRRLLLPAALVATAAACTGKTDSPAPAVGTTDARAPDARATDARATGASAAADGDSASGAVVTHSVPPTAQDRRLAVPDSGHTTDTNRSGMAVRTPGRSTGTP